MTKLELIKACNLEELIKKSKGKTLLNAGETLAALHTLEDNNRYLFITSTQFLLHDFKKNKSFSELNYSSLRNINPNNSEKDLRLLMFNENYLFESKYVSKTSLQKKLRNYIFFGKNNKLSKGRKYSRNETKYKLKSILLLKNNHINGVYINKADKNDYIFSIDKDLKEIDEKKEFSKTYEKYPELNKKLRKINDYKLKKLDNSYNIECKDHFINLVLGKYNKFKKNLAVKFNMFKFYEDKIEPVVFKYNPDQKHNLFYFHDNEEVYTKKNNFIVAGIFK